MSNTTILTPTLFTQYCDNYFLGTSAPKNILNGHITQQLPTLIKNVETSLNSMLNGRLYNKYNPANLTFNGNNILSPQVEQETLYSLLTESVLYKIQTGTYVNVSNNFGGNVNGSNNFNTTNSNVVGLRNDIRDKLVLIGLYKNANFANAATPNLYEKASPGVNQGPLTMQQTAQLNTYLSTNNFTLGGKWDFANLLINGTQINTYVDNLINQSEGSANSVLINYLPSTQVPLITQKDITNWNTWYQNAVGSYQGLTQILQNYITNAPAGTGNPVPLITSQDITNWNNNNTTVNTNVQTIATLLNILKNYVPSSEVPLINQANINQWSDTATAATAILTNYWPNTAIPTITQADINKWNTNSSAPTPTSFNIKKTTYTLTITNTWSLEFNNQYMVLTETNHVISPDPSANGLTFQLNSNVNLPTMNPVLSFNVLANSQTTILSLFMYAGVANTSSNTWTNLSDINLPTNWNFSCSMAVLNYNSGVEYGQWSIYEQSQIPPIYLPVSNSPIAQLQYNYFIENNGSSSTPSNQTITEINTIMFDILTIE